VTERAVLPRESLPTAPSHVAVQREVAAPSATTQTAPPREAARPAPSATTQTAPPRDAARPAPSVVVAPREVPPPPAPSHDSAPASSVATPPRESIVSPASAPAAPREKTLPAPAAAVAPPRKEAGESARGDASSAQAPSETPSASAATHGSDTLDLKAKLRDDWQQIKRDATNVGGDVRGALRRFRDWLK
jgi:hypothetical protein